MDKSDPNKLAILGGKPMRTKPWPVWPRADKNTEKNLLDVLYSGRWAISGCYLGKKPFERKFAESFAKFHNVPYCVPTTNGSSALKIALQALDIGFGKEVLVPGLTWVSCASSVIEVGASPILVDIDPESLCMSVEGARKSITEKTAAIMLVHLYSRIADMDGFLKLSEDTGIPIIEDCSQAHGAIWNGKRVGTLGKIGTFSMQQTKVLTSGEGGAVITRDEYLYIKMQQFRADGRIYKTESIGIGEMELNEIGTVLGRNHCMSEFHAAILLDRLQHLDEEIKLRAKNGSYLNSQLQKIGDIFPLKPSLKTDLPTYYQYCVRLNLEEFGNHSIEFITKALKAELNMPINNIYTSLDHHTLYTPLASKNIPSTEQIKESHNPKRFHLPIAEKVSKEWLAIPHHILLGTYEDMDDIAEAFFKVKKCSKSKC